jgi:hypothetical protein
MMMKTTRLLFLLLLLVLPLQLSPEVSEAHRHKLCHFTRAPVSRVAFSCEGHRAAAATTTTTTTTTTVGPTTSNINARSADAFVPP